MVDLSTGNITLPWLTWFQTTANSNGTNSPTTPNINLLWSKTNTGEAIYSSPIFVPNFSSASYSGPVFIYQSWDWYLYVVDAYTGNTIWRYAFGGPNYGRCQYLNTGTSQYIYGASHEGYIYCLDQNGTRLWAVPNLYYRENTGTAYYNGAGLFTDGSKNWATNSFCGNGDNANINVGGVVTTMDSCSGSNFTVASTGGLTAGNYGYIITPLYASDIYYQHAGESSLESGNPYLYISGFDNQIIKINAIYGSIVWKFATLQNCEPYPIIFTDATGRLVCAAVSVDANIYLLDAATGALLHTLKCGGGFDGFIRYGTIKGTNDVYVVAGCRDGRIYSVNTTTGTIDASSTVFTQPSGLGIDTGIVLVPNGDGTSDFIMADWPGDLVRLDYSMNIKWRVTLGFTVRSTPLLITVRGIKYVMVCDMSGDVLFYTLDGNLRSKYYIKGSIEGTPWIGDIGDKNLSACITSNDGTVNLIQIVGI